VECVHGKQGIIARELVYYPRIQRPKVTASKREIEPERRVKERAECSRGRLTSDPSLQTHQAYLNENHEVIFRSEIEVKVQL
jgi:hypothetical protein